MAHTARSRTTTEQVRTRGAFRIRRALPADRERLLALHEEAYADAPRSEAFFRWRFEHNPLRRMAAVLAEDEDGAAVGFYGGIYHRIHLDGRPCLALHQADTALASRLRGGLAGGRVLRALMRASYDWTLGPEVQVAWGFPEPAVRRLGLRHLGFEVLRNVDFLLRPVEEDGGEEDGGELSPMPVRRVPRFGPAADRLERRCRRSLCSGILRDARYLNWRYAERPDVEARLFEARDAAGGLRGLAVARDGGWEPRLQSILDWLVPPEDLDAEQALLQALRDDARRRGLAWQAAWFGGGGPWFQRFQRRHGFFVQPTPLMHFARVYARGYSVPWLATQWYHTMGDIESF